MPLEAGEFKHKNFETELPAGWFPKAHDQAEGLNVVFASPTGGGAVSFGFSVVEDNMDSRFLAERMAAQPSLKAKAWPLEGADGIYAVEYKLHNTNRVVMVAFILGQRGLIYQQMGNVSEYGREIGILWNNLKSSDPEEQKVIDYARRNFLATSQGHLYQK